MALTEARKAISVNFQNSVEWGTPVLFMRSPDGVLFRMDIGKTSQRKPSGIKSPPARITQNQSAEIRETLKSSPATDSSTNKAFSPAKLPESSIPPQTLPVEQNQTPTSSPAMTGKDMPGQDAVQNSRPIPQISPADEEPATKPQARKLSPGLYITFLRLILISLAVLLVLLAGKYSWIYLSEQMLKTGSTKVWPKDGMVTVYVPKGEFLMGSTEEQVSPFMDECPNCIYRNEQPQHTIYLDAFWIDKTEVTNKQYAECVNKSGCPLPLKTQSGTHNFYYNNSAYENYPVIYVSWNDAKKYCSWAGRRLPSEAEWEKAARGVDGRIYPWGNQEPDCTLANYRSTIETYCVGDTTSVGSYPNGGSVYGALDMVGNVWEWVNDTYDPGYYSVSPKNNPIGPTETPELMTLGLRGGGWPIISVNLRTANRNYGEPDYSHNSVGFRCAASP
jgi:formylglycine-generating enzyme required for sulfatase activity